MKYLRILVAFLFLTWLSCTSNTTSSDPNEQKETVEVKEETPVFSNAEEMPRFPGCEEKTMTERQACATIKLVEYVRSNLKYPLKAKEAGVEGTAVVGFNVETDGSIAKIEILRDPGMGTGDEAKRIVETFPNFIPGKEKGETVVVRYNLPVKFKLN